MTTNDQVRAHYEAAAPGKNLPATFRAIVDRLSPQEFAAASDAGFDQFHLRGIAATAELARLAGIDASTYVLDAGSGFGGPSRYLAKTCGCRVLGVDLTPSFVEIAKISAERLDVAALVSYEVGDLAALPIGDNVFDLVWTQHVVMNVPDRNTVYRGFERVLKPGGRLAFYDVIAADDGAQPQYPVPWADTEATSFLMTQAETIAALERAGFRIEAWDDRTDAAIAWFEASVPAAVPHGLTLGALLGPRFGAMSANFGRSVREGKVRIAMGIGEVMRR